MRRIVPEDRRSPLGRPESETKAEKNNWKRMNSEDGKVANVQVAESAHPNTQRSAAPELTTRAHDAPCSIIIAFHSPAVAHHAWPTSESAQGGILIVRSSERAHGISSTRRKRRKTTIFDCKKQERQKVKRTHKHHEAEHLSVSLPLFFQRTFAFSSHDPFTIAIAFNIAARSISQITLEIARRPRNGRTLHGIRVSDLWQSSAAGSVWEKVMESALTLKSKRKKKFRLRNTHFFSKQKEISMRERRNALSNRRSNHKKRIFVKSEKTVNKLWDKPQMDTRDWNLKPKTDLMVLFCAPKLLSSRVDSEWFNSIVSSRIRKQEEEKHKRRRKGTARWHTLQLACHCPDMATSSSTRWLNVRVLWLLFS